MALYAFDGTWNDSSAPLYKRNPAKDTNVHRFRELYGEEHFYKDGVGTRYGFIGKIVGGITGAGAQKRIDELFEALKGRFKAGDTTIDVIGYSRGAAIARMFVHRLERDFDIIHDHQGQILKAPPAVRFLGLFDTVASFGVPWDANEHDFVNAVPEFVENTYHAMALDETRETFGIERCLGDRDRITEVWFRGGHGDIGGNATFKDKRKRGDTSNIKRSNIALNWMLLKAHACGLPVPRTQGDKQSAGTNVKAPVTSRDELISIGDAGTMSRRIHVGDLVHYSVEQTELTHGIDGRLLRRIDVLTRIEDKNLEKRRQAMNWTPPFQLSQGLDNIKTTESNPSLVQLSLRRYPFDCLPARTWTAWLETWQLDNPGIEENRLDEFWAPNPADRALAWDIYVELQTRITVQTLEDGTGDDATALLSIVRLFELSRECMRQHGVECTNTAALLTAFLNQKVRKFTAGWHKKSIEEDWKNNNAIEHPEFRSELKQLQEKLRTLAAALSQLADAQL